MKTLCTACGQALPDSDGLMLDFTTRSVQFDGQSVRLTLGEYDLLHILAQKRGRAINKRAIYDQLYGLRPDCDLPEYKIVDVWICKLRRKIAPLRLAIRTVWGTGYMLEAPVQTEKAAA